MSAPIVVIGAGLAGWTTVREFRKLDTDTPVVMVTSDSGDFYAKPSLSNAFAQKRLPAQLISTPAAKMAETLNVTLMPHTQVTGMDVEGRTLALQSAVEASTLAFSQLVIATGARPIRAPMNGNAVGQVHVVNSLDDFAIFHALLQPKDAENLETLSKTIVLIGAGLIGCEFANDLVQAGHTVHVVDPAPRPLAALLPEAAGLELQKALTDLGTHWHFGATVQMVETAGSSGLQITLSDGTTLSTDVVLSAIGLRADTALAAAAGLNCERGIVVDDHLRTSAAHIFALGDCAEYASAGQRTLPYVMPIMNAAKVLAANLAGQPTALTFPLMPVSIKTPAWPIVVSAAHPSVAGEWVADMNEASGVWRFIDNHGVQRGFVLTAKQTARRMELSKSTVL
jgi:rubredoxin-NAD+ reductase